MPAVDVCKQQTPSIENVILLKKECPTIEDQRRRPKYNISYSLHL